MHPGGNGRSADAGLAGRDCEGAATGPTGRLGCRELAALFDFFADYDIIPFDESAVAIFEQFGRIHIGAMDKKIAAIALANNALLLTANRRDFEQVPNLRFDNWMDPPPTP